MRRGDTAVAANLAPQVAADQPARVRRAVLLATETGATVMRDGVQLPPESAVVVALA